MDCSCTFSYLCKHQVSYLVGHLAEPTASDSCQTAIYNWNISLASITLGVHVNELSQGLA